MEAIHQYARIRRRDGAYRWGIYRDTEVANRYLEIFLVNSLAEHLHNTSDTSKVTTSWKDAYSGYAASDPMVRHLIYADSIET